MRRKGRRGFPSAPTGTPAPAETLAPAESADELVIEELEELDVPLADLPDDGVPLADLPKDPEEFEELADEDVPLASVPETGDAMLAWASAAALSGLGLVFLSRKKKEESN